MFQVKTHYFILKNLRQASKEWNGPTGWQFIGPLQ